MNQLGKKERKKEEKKREKAEQERRRREESKRSGGAATPSATRLGRPSTQGGVMAPSPAPGAPDAPIAPSSSPIHSSQGCAIGAPGGVQTQELSLETSGNRPGSEPPSASPTFLKGPSAGIQTLKLFPSLPANRRSIPIITGGVHAPSQAPGVPDAPIAP